MTRIPATFFYMYALLKIRSQSTQTNLLADYSFEQSWSGVEAYLLHSIWAGYTRKLSFRKAIQNHHVFVKTAYSWSMLIQKNIFLKQPGGKPPLLGIAQLSDVTETLTRNEISGLAIFQALFSPANLQKESVPGNWQQADKGTVGLHDIVKHLLPGLLEGKGDAQTLLQTQHLIQTSFKYLQGWRLNHFPGQPVPMLENPLGEEKFPNIQSKPPLVQLEAISSCPITCYLGEETDPHLSTTSFQVVEESDKVSPQPPFLQAKQSQLPQPLLIRLLLQTLHQLRCPSLDTLQHLNVSLVVGGPKLNTGFEVRPHQCRVQGDDHFPSPAGHAIFDTSQDAIGFLGRLGTLLAHIQAAVNQHPQVLLCQAAFQPLFPKPVALHGVAVAQVQDLALGLVEPHTIHPSPSIQPVQSLPPLKQINTPAQLGVVCKLTEIEDMVGLLGCECTLSAHVQLFIHQAALNPFIPKPVLIPGVAPTQVQDPALGLVEPHEIYMGPLLELVHVSLDGIASLRRVNHTTQLGVVCKQVEGALNPTVYATDEDIKQRWSQYGPLRDTICHRSPSGH
ncbi:hypothetical protein QYF61_008871 [Mycteria americana]|uniref:Uncharacterized protein n=1 Tax=Mycteria americana TaxID=33587 RepID=A0AAN7RYV5_MYCAM|nr:hypothetical protein QYF61_008871 [Mycteria americana]